MGTCFPRKKETTVTTTVNVPSSIANQSIIETPPQTIKYDDLLLTAAFAHDIIGTNNEGNHTFPEALIPLIESYLDRIWKWDIDSNKDDRLTVSGDGMTVHSSTDNYITGLIFTSIFMDQWIVKEGRYWFKFKFHGSVLGASDEIAIGLISKEYDMGNPYGIGVDKHGWSWYVWSQQSSSVYLQTFGETLAFGLVDGAECIFEVIIRNGRCTTNIYHSNFETLMQSAEYDTVKPPIKLGVSMNSKINPMSLCIVEQHKPDGVR